MPKHDLNGHSRQCEGNSIHVDDVKASVVTLTAMFQTLRLKTIGHNYICTLIDYL